MIYSRLHCWLIIEPELEPRPPDLFLGGKSEVQTLQNDPDD